ncbi:hypothetical protein BHM03_00061685, partial [Ensete ventricosum]
GGYPCPRAGAAGLRWQPLWASGIALHRRCPNCYTLATRVAPCGLATSGLTALPMGGCPSYRCRWPPLLQVPLTAPVGVALQSALAIGGPTTLCKQLPPIGGLGRSRPPL